MRSPGLRGFLRSGTFIPRNHERPSLNTGRVPFLNEAPDGCRLAEYRRFVKGFDVAGEESVARSVASAATFEDSIVCRQLMTPIMDTNRVKGMPAAGRVVDERR
jgi:hypothetical protein